ncbi:MAG: putative DNA-binding protein YwzG [Saprospiraceae bacterium]|nr:MAG: putative DNA-binding protein YwzG [Saprospiraceae bacterium]
MNKNKEFLSGTLNTIILALLKEHGKMYGYEICSSAKEKTNNAIILTEGAIYPALHKLEKKGIIESSKQLINGRTRKYYEIRKAHLDTVDEKVQTLYDFTTLIQALLKPSL